MCILQDGVIQCSNEPAKASDSGKQSDEVDPKLSQLTIQKMNNKIVPFEYNEVIPSVIPVGSIVRVNDSDKKKISILINILLEMTEQ